MLARRLIAALCYVAGQAAAAPGDWPTTDFKTEPDIRLSLLNISTITPDPSRLAPGYLFITNDPGLQIYDQDGTLVWLRHSEDLHRDQDFHPCDYLGQVDAHLCWHDTSLKGPVNTAKGHNVVYDNTYTKISRNYKTGINGITPNLHAFHMLPGGYSFLQPVYVPRERDLTHFGGNETGMVWDGCFQEIDTETAEPLFEWCVLDYYPLWESTLFFTNEEEQAPPGQTNATSPKAGFGNSEFPWDFFHINAIDKNNEGDYLVSSRHFDQILKIAGARAAEIHGVEPGTTLWRLGGWGNQFQLDGFTFTKQHAVRYITSGASETVISILNNAWEGKVDPSAEHSAGQIIKVNNKTMQATLLKEYPHPDGLLTASRGDLQLLPNKNILMGWGEVPDVTEFDHEGNVLFHARIGMADYKISSYRAFKSPWTGYPSWGPKLLPYQSTCESTAPLVAFVSWNGATEVRRWRFRIATQSHGPWFPAGETDKEGFETRMFLSGWEWLSPFIPYVSVDALDANGTVLGSTTSSTWVPNRDLNITCGEFGCFEPAHFAYDPDWSDAASCHPKNRPGIAVLVVFLLFIESVNYTVQTLSVWVLEKLRRRGGSSISERVEDKILHLRWREKMFRREAADFISRLLSTIF